MKSDTIVHLTDSPNAICLCEEFVTAYNTYTPVNDLWNKFLDICNTCTCMKLIPTKQISTKYCCPWITPSSKGLTRKKQCAYNRACLTNLQTDWLCYRDIKKQSQQGCRLAYNKYLSSLVDPSSNTVTKRLWTLIKNKRKGVSPLVDHGITYTDPKTKLTCWQITFLQSLLLKTLSISLP